MLLKFVEACEKNQKCFQCFESVFKAKEKNVFSRPNANLCRKHFQKSKQKKRRNIKFQNICLNRLLY